MQTNTTNRRLAAIMFSDICGYSRIMGASEDRAMRILGRHDQLVGATIQEYGGNIIKRMGDGLLAEFHSAVASVECALSIQRRLAAYNGKQPESERFLVRIGVHLGDVMVVGNDILGDGVNVASRIEPLAEPGGICISQDVFNQVHNKVEMQVVSLGPQQLKNITRQIEIFRVLAAAAADMGTTSDTAGTQPQAVPTVVHAQPGAAAAGKRLWKRLILAAALCLLTLLTVAALAWRIQQRKLAGLRATLAQAGELLNQEHPGEARKLLEEMAGRVRPGSPLANETAALLDKAMAAETEAGLRKRAQAFLELVFTGEQEDVEALREFLTASDRGRLGETGVRDRLKMLRAVARLMRLQPGEIRIAQVLMDKEDARAVITPELLVRDRWTQGKDSHWQQVDGQWYIVLEDKRPKDMGGDTTRTLPEQPRRQWPPRPPARN